MGAAPLPTLTTIIHESQNACVCFPPPPCSSRPASLVVSWPNPPSLYPRLIAIGAGEKVAKAMDRACNARALELRSYYEGSIKNALGSLTDLPRDSERRILDTFASLYLTKVKAWIEEGVAVYEGNRKFVKQVARNNDVLRDNHPRQTFNADYIPHLEYFFDENPFPTHADKMLLADKSGMTYRQIHVWFQNRRNRTKKPDTAWRRKSVREPSAPRMRRRKSIIRGPRNPCVAPQSTPISEQYSIQEDYSSEATSHRVAPDACGNNILDKYSAPPHAFPSSYPPVCSYDPFPLESRNQLFSTVQWEKRSNYNISPHSDETIVNELTDRFSLLSVRDKRSHRSHEPTHDSLAATYSITTTPAPAPHPALLPPVNTVSSFLRLSPFPTTRASQSTLAAFAESTSPSILTLHPIKSGNVSHRRVLPLPKRHPRSPLLCRDVPSSDVLSSTPSPRSSTRSLSDSSDLDACHPKCNIQAR